MPLPMISAVVLTHNSALTLRNTLLSLGFCDETVVIDDNSTDDTVNLAQNLGAKVFRRALSGDFAAQRNFALTRARGEWVLFVDADEVVSPDLAEEILGVTQNTGVLGWYVKRQDHLWGRVLRHGETSSVRLLRLGQKSAGAWQGTVHEVWNIEGVVGTLDHPLDHFPHPNVAQFLQEINTYSTLRARELFAKHIREPIWYIPVYPAAKFFVNYFWRKGFLDGTAGAVVALIMSFHSFLVRAKLWQLWHKRA